MLPIVQPPPQQSQVALHGPEWFVVKLLLLKLQVEVVVVERHDFLKGKWRRLGVAFQVDALLKKYKIKYEITFR